MKYKKTLVKPIDIDTKQNDFRNDEDFLECGPRISKKNLDETIKLEKKEIERIEKELNEIDKKIKPIFARTEDDILAMNKLTLEEKLRKSKIVSYIKPDTMIRLNLALHYKDCRVADFVRVLVDGFLKEDKRIISFFDENIKGNNRFKTIYKRNKQKEQEIKIKFGLDEEELNTIYNILEDEVGF